MFNQKLADDVIRFFSRRLKHTKGTYAGRPFTPIPYQEKLLRDIFGTVKANGFRQYTTVYAETPKKNGKSELGAGVGLAGLFLDNEPGAEVYAVAKTRGQAGKVFGVAAQMVRSDALLSAEARIVDSTKTIYLKNDPTSYFKVLSADASIEDGCNPHMVIFDELHRQTNRDLWDIFKYGKGTRSQPLLFAITTAGVSGHSPICEDQHDYARRILQGTITDPSFYPALYCIDEEEDWTFEGEPADPETGREATGWFKANPALGYFLDIEVLREDFKTALQMPSEQNSFRRFRLSQWVAQETRAIPMDKWKACGRGFKLADLAGRDCYGGLDLSTTKDLTAFLLIFPIDGNYIWLPFIFVPDEDLVKRSRRDNVPYDLWAKQGFVHLTPGNEVDYKFVEKKIQDCADTYNIREVGYDSWNATSVVRDLINDGLKMIPIRQGYGSLNAPTGEALSWIKTGKMIHDNNPCLSWMADCMSLMSDPAGNIKPKKVDRMKSSKRIDGMAAAINATARIIVTDDYKQSGYAKHGLRSIG
jgi:phage terminase large subunit-like protein